MRPLHGLASFAALAAAPLAAAAAQGSTMATDDWIQTSAIQWSGGVRVAAGDVTGDSGTAAPGGEHEFEYDVLVGKSPPPPGPGTLTAAPRPPSEAKEMDRSSTRLARFAINGNSPGPCRVGTRYPALRLNDGRNRWTLTGVSVVRCGADGMTVSYRTRRAS